MTLLNAFSFWCAIGSAIAGLVGGIKARSLVPDSASHVRNLVEILEAHLFATKQHLSTTLKRVEAQGGLEGKWDSATYSALRQATESAETLYSRLRDGPALDTTKQSKIAGSARLWMAVGASLAALSAALQLALPLL